MPSCAVPHCKNRLDQGYRFFRFPRDKTRREEWVQNMGRENWEPTENSRICNAHFEYSQFELYRQDNLMKLKQIAVPTLFDILNPPPKESYQVVVDTEPSLICDTTSDIGFLLVDNLLQNGVTPLGVYVQREEGQKDQEKVKSHMDKQESLCRLCLAASPVQRLINSNESTMLEAVAAIKLSEKTHLNKACIKCLLNLKLAFQIQQRIIKSHNWFIEHVDHAEEANSGSCEIIKIKAERIEEDIESETSTNHSEISSNRVEKEHSDRGSTHNTNNNLEIIMIKTEKDLEDKGNSKSIFADFNLGKCPICGKNNSTVEHAQSHYKSLHKCDACNFNFKDIQEYSHHMNEKHKMENLNCPECKLCFKYQSLYNIHISTAHPKKAKLKSHLSGVGENRGFRRPYERSNSSVIHWVHYKSKDIKPEPGIEELHDCAECGKSFLDEKQYLRHAKVHDKITCPICKREITRYNYSRHYALHGPGMPQLVCEICGSVCKNKGSLRTHIYYTHSQRSLPCEHCGKVFRKKYDLVMHTKKEHTGEKNHVCDICGKKYYTRYKLNGHIKILHLKERKFVCRFCDKSLSSKHALRTHERQHTNESPYKCEICAEGFRQNVSLRWHRKSKHNCTEEKTAECKVCGKKFVNIFAVKSHMRMHDP